MDKKLFAGLTASIIELEQFPAAKVLLRKKGRLDAAILTTDTIIELKNILAEYSGMRKLNGNLQSIHRFGAVLDQLKQSQLEKSVYSQLIEKNDCDHYESADRWLEETHSRLVAETDQRFQRMKLKMEMFKIRETLEQAELWLHQADNHRDFLPFMQKWVLNELFPIQMILASELLEFYPVKIRSLLKTIHTLYIVSIWMSGLQKNTWDGICGRILAIHRTLEEIAAVDGLYSYFRNEFKQFHTRSGQALTQSRRSNETSAKLWESVVEGFDTYHPECLSRMIQALFEYRSERNLILLDEWNLAQDEKIWTRYYNNFID